MPPPFATLMVANEGVLDGAGRDHPLPAAPGAGYVHPGGESGREAANDQARRSTARTAGTRIGARFLGDAMWAPFLPPLSSFASVPTHV